MSHAIFSFAQKSMGTICIVLLVVISPQINALNDGSFSDQTSGSGVTGSTNIGQISPILGGGSVGDFNNDGWQDFFYPTGGNGPDKLYINNQDGTFTDQANNWGLTQTHLSAASAVADFNNDGLLDIYVTNMGDVNNPLPGQHILYKNMGTHFINVAANAGVNQTSSSQIDGWSPAWGDYDLDGDLDLAVAGFREVSGGDTLFRNNGDGTFTDVTISAGLVSLNNTSGYTPRFIDMDGDRYPELIWIGDFSTSLYFVNNADGTFTDATASSNTSQDHSEMGSTVADWDRDGDFDFFVTTISTNNLYINQGNHVYSNQAQTAGIEDTDWGWGATSLDFNHDAAVDLVVAAQIGSSFALINRINDNNLLTFEDITVASGLEGSQDGRGVARLDYDNDGDQDLIFFPGGSNIEVFRNELTGPDINWIRIFLNNSNLYGIAPNGIGAVIKVKTSLQEQISRIDAGNNYMSQDEMSAHFGLGAASMITEITVNWPNGLTTVLQNVPSNQTLTIHAPIDIFQSGFESQQQ